MRKLAALPNEVNTAVDVLVRKRTRGSGDALAQATNRAEVVAELINDFDEALTEVAHDLRTHRVTWREIALLLGFPSAGAAERRFSKRLPDQRVREKQAQPTKTPPGLEGVTVTAAAQETGMSPTTVRHYIDANLSNSAATWFTRTPAPNKKGYVDRITDLDGLKNARSAATKTTI